MSLFTLLVILLATLGTSILSGVFGMTGGLLLLGVLTALTPVAMAMALHGAIQATANGWRAFLLRRHVRVDLVIRYALGAVGAGCLLLFLVWRPDKIMVYFLLGASAMLVWVPTARLRLDICARGQAEACGLLVQSVNTLAGVAGPLLDIFFVRARLSRHQIVATKAATQIIAHLVKIGVWSAALVRTLQDDPPAMSLVWLLAAIPLAMIGTWAGHALLNRISDRAFRVSTQWLITVIGVAYLARALASL